MNKITKVLLAFLLVLPLVTPVSVNAQTPTGTNGTPSLKKRIEERLEKRQEIKNKKAMISQATIKSISGNTIVVTKDSADYTVNVTDKTRLVRRYGGKSDLKEFAAGQLVSVMGTWTDETQKTVDAKLVRNLSIAKFRGVAIGTLKSKTDGGFVLTTQNRGDVTVSDISKAKIVNRKNQTIAYTDIKEGDKVRVKGLLDHTLKTVTEVTQIKDYNLPVVVKPTVTSTPAT